MLGLGTKPQPKATATKATAKQDKSAADEANEILAKMEAKKADGDCAFC